MWSMFKKKPLQNFARCRKGDGLHLLKRTASTNMCLIVRLCKKRLSIYNWNPGSRRGKEDAFEKQIAGKWHVITLQEASEYVDHDIMTNRFHATHYGGCAFLYNKGFCKGCFHVPHFVDLHSAARKLLQLCPNTLAISTPKNGVSRKSSSSQSVPS